MTTHPPRFRRWSALTVGALLLLGALVPVAATAPAAADDAVTPDPEPSVDLCEHVPAAVFRDVPAGNLHAANVDCIAAHRVIVGVGGGNYAPDLPVKRAQMASFLINLVEVAGDQLHEVPAVNPFGDVIGTTHADNVAIAAHLRIARGVTATTYSPTRDVTRAQMASFVAQAIIAAGAALPASPPNAFGDAGGSIHQANIDRLAAVDVVSGVGGGRYDPSATVSRAQMATFLANAARYLHGDARWFAPPIGGTADEDVAADLALSGVIRPTSASDLLELRWNRSVAPAGDPAGVQVLGADGTSLVAKGATITAHGTTAVHINLDVALQADATYWISVPAGLVADGDAQVNGSQTLAFVFADTSSNTGDGPADPPAALPIVSDIAVDAEAIAAGGEVTTQSSEPVMTGSASAAGSTVDEVEYRVNGGSWISATAVDGAFDAGTETFTATVGPLGVATHSVELRSRAANGLTSSIYAFSVTVGPLVPEVVSVVTDPVENRLVVSFNTEVVCPDEGNTRASLEFLNDGATAENGLQRGSPAQVQASPGDSSKCLLSYFEIADNDQGLLNYTQPGVESARLRSTAGIDVASFSAFPVTKAS